MDILFDTHTHTLSSGHAFSTLEECASACVRKGMDGFTVTDHGPAMQGAPPPIYFNSLSLLPRMLGGVHLLRGAETNILDFQGKLDLPTSILRRMDVCIASLHEIVVRPQTAREHTQAWLAVVQNPMVDILGHSGRGAFAFDIDTVIPACRANSKIVEINNHTLGNPDNVDNCRRIAAACMHYGVPVVVSSDAHIAAAVGQVQRALALLAEIGFPEELVLNRSFARFWAYLLERKPWLAADDA